MRSPRTIALLGIFCTAMAGSPGLAQDEEAKVERDKELPGRLKELKKAAEDRKKERDPAATQMIDRLVAAYAGMHEKDQGLVVKQLGDILVTARVKRAPPEKGLFVAAAFGLGQMGEAGARALVRAYDNKKYSPERDWIELRAVFLKNIGKTKGLRQVDFLLERATRDPSDHILRAAGEALGNYAEADQKVRKEIAKELIKKFNEVFNKSRQSLDPGDAILKRAKETMAAISRDWHQTLKQLTGQDINSPDEWQHFWNKNKSKDWDKLKS